MANELKEIGARILDELKSSSKSVWESWTPEEKKLVEACMKDAASVAAKAIAGIDVSPEKAQIDAQLAVVKAAGGQAASRVVWDVAGKILQMAATVLMRR